MDALTLLVSVAATLLLLVLIIKLPGALYSYYIKCQAVKDIPGWPTHWLWGNLHQITLTQTMSDQWTDYIFRNRFKLTRSWFGPFVPLVAVQHCSLVGAVLKEPKSENMYGLIKPWLGDGLLISSGKKWFRNRRLLTPAFHYEILKQYVGVYNSCTEVLLTKWSQSAAEGKPVKLFQTISLLSLDVIMQCAFSFQSDCQVATNTHPYIQTVQDLVELSATRFLKLLYRSDWIYSLTPDGRRFFRACKKAHQHSEKVIEERKKSLGLGSDKKAMNQDELLDEARKKRHLDFLDILLTAEDEQGEGLTDLEIRDEVDTFMFEGHDTTTSGMCWTLYCLAKHPEHQEKVREEVRSVLMGREWLEYDDLKELKYTQWCIKEAMRLYPPVSDIYRVLSEDKMIEGVLIPKGTHVSIKMYHYHRHPDIWENPNVYDPLRFSPANSEGRHPFAYIPFSAGNRNCIGQNFALNEEKVVVSTVINHFKLSLDPEQKVEFNPIGIFKVKGDIEVLLEPLNT